MRGEVGSYEQQVIRGKYFPHIDGIRAIAVLAVLLYHLQSGLCPGGFIGVDVFFVISGYLIGGGILRELREGSFSFVDFYARRIKRIMPAYFAVILATLVTGLFLYHYEPLSSLGNATLRSAYFCANFFCYKFLGDYFAGDADSHPLMNLWSLSVEEQFYIIIPLIMFLVLGVSRKSTRAQMVVLGLLLILSFVDSERLLASNSARSQLKAFYYLESRAWELLAGVVIAGIPTISQSKNKILRSLAPWGAFFGLICILASCVYAGGTNAHFPGYGALGAVVGAGLMIYGGGSGLISGGLSSNVIVGIGRISYSLYLWHWPIIVYMRYCFGRELSSWHILFAAVASFTIAYLSWRYIEMPIRRNKSITSGKAFTGLLCMCVLVAGIGAVLFKTNGLIHVLHANANKYASLETKKDLPSWQDGKYGLHQLTVTDNVGKLHHDAIETLGQGKAAPSFFLMGDSYAECFRTGLSRVCKTHRAEGVALRLKVCPLDGIKIANSFRSDVKEVLEWLQHAPSIKKVVIMCRWDTRLSTSNTNQYLYREGEAESNDARHNTQLLEEGLIGTCRRIRDMGKEVLIIAPTPRLKISPGTEVRRRIMLGLDLSDIGDAITMSEFLAAEKPVFEMLTRVSAASGARIIPIHPYLEQDGAFRGMYRDKLFYHDTNHLSPDGAQHVAEHIIAEIQQ